MKLILRQSSRYLFGKLLLFTTHQTNYFIIIILSNDLTMMPYLILYLIPFNNFSLTMRFTIFPKSFICFTKTIKLAITVLFIIYIPSFISFTIAPDKTTLPMHFTIFPITLITSTIWPYIISLSFKFVITKFSIVFLFELCSN